jgi:hypothetical protein
MSKDGGRGHHGVGELLRVVGKIGRPTQGSLSRDKLLVGIFLGRLAEMLLR